MREAWHEFWAAFATIFRAGRRTAKSLENMAEYAEMTTEAMVTEGRIEHQQKLKSIQLLASTKAAK